MTRSTLAMRPYLASLLCAFLLLFTAASCGSDKGKVEGVNMLYGSSSKVWVTDKQTDAAGDKVKQDDAAKEQEISFASNGTYSGTQSGKYVFDQTAKTITMTPEGSPTSSTFNIETLTDDKLTLVNPNSPESKLMLKAK